MGGDEDDLRDAYAAARTLREEAESDAAEIRRAAEAAADLTTADANRFAARRLKEVELLVGKAKRALLAAEERSKVVIETAQRDAEEMLLEAREQARQIAAGKAPATPRRRASDKRRDEVARHVADLESELDRLLATALAKALDLPIDEPYPRRGPGRRPPR